MSIQSDPQLQGIKELMVNSGLSEEAAGKICEVMIGYGNDYKRRVDEEYTARVEQARKICIEETEAHKLELGRRMQIFLEAKDHQIGQTLARQNAGREGEAPNRSWPGFRPCLRACRLVAMSLSRVRTTSCSGPSGSSRRSAIPGHRHRQPSDRAGREGHEA
jgi:hypothetical protein